MELQIHDNYTNGFIANDAMDQLAGRLELAHNSLLNRSGKGNDFLGWLDLPERMIADELLWKQIEAIRSSWKNKKISHIVVVGIGGSYLGAKALYEAFRLPFSGSEYPELIFAGHHMSAAYLESLCGYLENISFGLIVISKSGTTLEPALAFRILRELLVRKDGADEANERIVAVTDAEKGALRKMSDEAGWPSFVIEDSVGGRYSVLSPVGLLPLSLAGINVKNILAGAARMQKICMTETNLSQNPALHYAALRFLLYGSGKKVEVLASFQPELQYLAEWWKQLFGESDGKELKGIFPASVMYSTDLHSLGQYIQDGERVLFETCIVIRNKSGLMEFPASEKNEDGLEYLKGRKVSEINSMAEQATMLAHFEGDVPVIGISLPALDEMSIGGLICFFEFACAIGGYLLDVNPFDQPGVEAYKNNMFALLGKPGMEEATAEILKKINNVSKK